MLKISKTVVTGDGKKNKVGYSYQDFFKNQHHNQLLKMIAMEIVHWCAMEICQCKTNQTLCKIRLMYTSGFGCTSYSLLSIYPNQQC